MLPSIGRKERGGRDWAKAAQQTSMQTHHKAKRPTWAVYLILLNSQKFLEQWQTTRPFSWNGDFHPCAATRRAFNFQVALEHFSARRHTGQSNRLAPIRFHSGPINIKPPSIIFNRQCHPKLMDIYRHYCLAGVGM